MLTPKVKAKDFAKYGFKRCKGIPRDSECYYLCVARGCKMIFVSDICFDIIDWGKDDPRIHKRACWKAAFIRMVEIEWVDQ